MEQDKKETMNFVYSIGVAGALGLEAFYGERLQYLARQGIKEHTWLAGHMADFFGPAALTVVSAPIGVGFGVVSTISEFEVGTYDPQDIVCYWAGVATGIALAKLGNRIFLKNKKKLEQEL